MIEIAKAILSASEELESLLTMYGDVSDNDTEVLIRELHILNARLTRWLT